MEQRIFFILGSIVLGWHLLTIFGSFLTIFTDIFLILFLSWVLAFIIEPLAINLTRRGLPRLWAAALVYLAIAIIGLIFIVIVLPTTITQLSQMARTIPNYFPPGSSLAVKVDSFFNDSIANVPFALGLVSSAGGVLLIFVLSFYILVSKAEIFKFLLGIIPDEYEDDFKFLEKTINQTFASFLRAQIFMGIVLGVIVLVTLLILQVDFAVSTALIAGVLASIPALGAVLFIIPVFLAAFPQSLQTAVIAMIVVTLAAQLVFNFIAPKILSSQLKIHQIVVLLAFILGYKLAGVWGAVLGVPITSAVTIVLRDLIKYWKSEADKTR